MTVADLTCYACRLRSAAVGPGVLTVLTATVLLARPPADPAAPQGGNLRWKAGGRVSFLTLPTLQAGLRLSTPKSTGQPQWLAQLQAVVGDLSRRAARVSFHRSKVTTLLRPALSGEVSSPCFKYGLPPTEWL